MIITIPFNMGIRQVRLSQRLSQFSSGLTSRFLITQGNLMRLFNGQGVVSQYRSSLNVPTIRSRFGRVLFPTRAINRRYLILFTSTRFARRVVNSVEAYDLCGMIRLRFYEILSNLTISMCLSFLSLRHVTKRTCTAFCVIFAAIGKTCSGIAMRSEVKASGVASNVMMRIMSDALLLTYRTIRVRLIKVRTFSFFMDGNVRIYLLRINNCHITYQRIRRRGVIRFRFTRTQRAFMFPLEPFSMQLNIRCQ